MRQIGFLTLIPFFVAGAISGGKQLPKAPSTAELMLLGNTIVSHRLFTLADSSRIDFCEAKRLWDSKGQLLLGQMARGVSRYPSLMECPQDDSVSSRAFYYVAVTGISVYSDSLVVHGTTRRGDTEVFESYFLSRSGDRRTEYRAHIISQHRE